LTNLKVNIRENIRDVKINHNLNNHLNLNLNKSQVQTIPNDVCGNYRNITRENKLKEIFSSQGFIISSKNEFEVLPPKKNIQKITSKAYGDTIDEIRLEKNDLKRFRRNSAHTFHNKSGFYFN
jgi:hypothetical protein